MKKSTYTKTMKRHDVKLLNMAADMLAKFSENATDATKFVIIKRDFDDELTRPALELKSADINESAFFHMGKVVDICRALHCYGVLSYYVYVVDGQAVVRIY